MADEIKNAIESGRNVAVLGQAGTGKTQACVEAIRSLKMDNVAMTATTGVAAVNIGGTTLHSFAGLSSHVLRLSSEELHQVASANKGLRSRLESTKLIFIDEVSMLSAYTMDKLSTLLSVTLENKKPMGGIQCVFCGDFWQLPPVDDEFPAKLAFTSKAWSELNVKTITLSDVKRCNDSLLSRFMTPWIMLCCTLGLNPVERKIEELACSIHQRTGEIFNTADTSKRRTAKRRQLATEKGKLKVQAELYHKRNPDTTVDSIHSAVSTMRFPWSTRSCTSQITPEVLKAVEDYHLLNRTKEEIPILERERDTMIRVLSMRCMSSKNVFLQNLVDKAKDLFADHFEPVDLIAMFHDDELEPEGGDVSEDDVCSDVVDIVM